MKDLRTLAEQGSFRLFQKYLPLVFVLTGFVVAVPFLVLGEIYKAKIIQSIGFVFMLLGFFSSVFTAREVAIRMEQNKSMMFTDALAHTLYRYLTFWCFVPFFGPILERFLDRKKTTNPFTSDER